MQINTHFNIHKLNKEMYYCPSWNNDHKFFIKLLDKSHFTNQDIRQLSRFYIKYNHIYKKENYELKKYFNYILIKMKIYTIKNLLEYTRNNYNKQKYQNNQL